MRNEKIAHLAVKVKSLAAEGSVIRSDENRLKRRQRKASERGKADLADRLRSVRLGLADHRRFDVRAASRSAQLAYGYLRGVPYGAMEEKCWTPPDWDRVAKDVVRFGDGLSPATVKEGLRIWAAVLPIPRVKPAPRLRKPYVRPTSDAA